jgi:hypothetical protein
LDIILLACTEQQTITPALELATYPLELAKQIWKERERRENRERKRGRDKRERWGRKKREEREEREIVVSKS